MSDNQGSTCGATSLEVIAASEVRMYRSSSGTIYAEHVAGERSSWAPYTSAFGSLTVAARLRDESLAPAGHLAEGSGVKVAGLPHYSGLSGLIRCLPTLLKRVSELGARNTIFIGRIPEPLSILLYFRARILHAPFISLVVADPLQLARVNPGLRGKILGAVLVRFTKSAVRHSAAVIYVTQTWLQHVYPAPAGTPTIGRSNVILSPSAFVIEPRTHPSRLEKPRLVTIAALGGATKGVASLLKVLAMLGKQGRIATLTVVGSGKQLTALQELARSLGVEEQVAFAGHISDRATLLGELDRADIYVSMSRAEGLPRAIIEAMARGLPVLASNAGGTSEILADDCLVDIGDESGLIAKIGDACDRPEILDQMSRQNLASAHEVVELANPQRLSAFLVAAIDLIDQRLSKHKV